MLTYKFNDWEGNFWATVCNRLKDLGWRVSQFNSMYNDLVPPKEYHNV